VTNHDLALIVIATAASTAAVLIPCWYLHVRSYKRTLTGVRAVRNAYKAEAQQLREERLTSRRLSFAEHADTATRVTVDEPIPYGLAPDRYAPVWTSGWLLDDGTHVHTEFGQVVRTHFGRERV
jgi:hypothetical protein